MCIRDRLLEVQDDLSHVLENARERREFVLSVSNFDAGDCRAGNRRQQRATQRVTESVAKTRLQRLDNEAAAAVPDVLLLQCRTLSNKH